MMTEGKLVGAITRQMSPRPLAVFMCYQDMVDAFPEYRRGSGNVLCGVPIIPCEGHHTFLVTDNYDGPMMMAIG